MKTKLKFLGVLLALLVGGVNGVWAETIAFDYSESNGNLLSSATGASGGSSSTVVHTPITLTFQSTSNRSVESSSDHLKFQAGTSLTISCEGYCSITSIHITMRSGDSQYLSTIPSGYSYTSTTADWADATGTSSITFNTDGSHNADIVTSIEVTYTDSRTELSSSDFMFNRTDELYSGGSNNLYVNNTTFNTEASDPFEFVYDATKTTLRAKLNLLSAMSATAADFSVTSSNASVLDVSGATFSMSGNDRVYVNGIQVLSAGTANLTFTYRGSNTYKPANRTVTFNVKSPNTTFAGSYAYTWTFNDGQWENTKLQVGYYSNSGGNTPIWVINSGKTEVRNSGNISADNGIEKIQGLAFTAGTNSLCLDWTTNAIWLDGSVTIPNLKERQVITFTAVTDATITTGGTTLTGSNGVYTYTVTADAPSGLTFNVNGKHIYSIAVSSSSYAGEYSVTYSDGTIDGKIRPLAGTYTFTEAGPMDGGEVINEVPGITMMIGRTGAVWAVEEIDGVLYSKTEEATERTTAVATKGNFYVFRPYVNGFLSLNGKNTNNHCYLMDGNSQVVDYNGAFTGDWNITTYALKAGTTYYVVSQDHFYLHSFTFRPAFLEVDPSTGDLTDTEASKIDANGSRFTANMTTNASHFPHLITSAAGEGKVKFAGDMAIVNLATNNDVTLLGNGSTIIKGSVLKEGSDRELFAYYYLQSNVLTLQTYYKRPSSGSDSEIKNQAYVAQSDLQNGKLVFKFNNAITRTSAQTSGKVWFKALGSTNTDEGAGNWIDITSGWTNMDEAASGNLLVNIGTLVEGRTYQIRIDAGAVNHTSDATTQNSEINFQFTVTKTGEAQVEMIYPTGVASVATSVVLKVSASDGTSNDVSDSYTVQGVLTGGSGVPQTITAFYDGRNVIFKPTSTLQPNTTYTLTLDPEKQDNQTIHLKNGETVSTRKEFYFTTGAAAGTVPIVTVKVPADGALINVGNGTISFTFDQNIELEPYCRVSAIPINGSEATCDGMSRNVGGEWTLNATDSRTISFNYQADGLKYDMYYIVSLPANTVTGAGGKANEETTIKFKVNPAEGYTSDVYNFRNKEGYPYTWDLSMMKEADLTTITSTWTQDKDKNGNDLDNWCRPHMYNCYGKELSSTFSGTSKTEAYNKMDDLRGLRLTTAHDRSNNRIKIVSIDNAANRCLRFEGNTHYMCIPNVPKSADASNGEHFIYIEASVSSGGNSAFALNCPPEMAEWVGDAPTKDGDRHVYKIRVKENPAFDGFAAYDDTYGRDIPLVCSNVNIYKIAYSTYNKTLTSGGEGYATDAHDYHNSEITDKGVDYAMTATLAGQTVIPYYVTYVSGGYDKNTPGTITLTQVPDGVAPGQGTVLFGTAGTTFPIFAKAYSKANSETSANLLSSVVTSGIVTLNQQLDDNYYYVLNNQPIKVADDEGETQIGSSSGMGFYLVHKSTSIPMQAHSAYLIINRKLNQGGGVATSSGAREVYFFKFEDENGNDLTGISTMEADGIKDNSTNGDGLYYDLHGQRHVYPTKPGLYIHNGKKVYLK